MPLKVVGIKFQWNDRRYIDRFKLKFIDRLAEIGKLLKSDIKALSNKPFRSRGGKVMRSNPTRRGTPSKAGEPPKRDLGDFYKSIKYRVYKRKMTVEVFSDDPKSLWLELGTRKMAARPVFRISLKRNRGNINKLLGRKVVVT